MRYSKKFHNLLINKNVCSICLEEKSELTCWDTTHAIQKEGYAVEVSLKDMICSTFGSNVYALLLSNYFCDPCANSIIQSYIMLLDIKLNYRSIKFYTAKLTEQFDNGEETQTMAIKLDLVGTVNKLGIEINDDVFYEELNDKNYASLEESDHEKLKEEVISDNSDKEGGKTLHLAYECPICFLNFDLLLSYEEHYKICYRNTNMVDLMSNKDDEDDEDDKIIDYTCGMCSASFLEMADLLTHRKSHKQTQERRKRSLNGKFNNEMRKKTKMRSKVICDICGKATDSMYINKHRKVHRHQKQCAVCLKFVSVSAFGNHMLIVHGLDDEIYKPNCIKSCPYCPYATKQSHLLDGHINKNHLGIRPYLCDICNKPFHCKHQLGGHIKTHFTDKTEQCDLCGDRFKYKRSLVMHLRLHTGEKPVKCTYCDMYFTNTSRRREHEVDHHLVVEFKCEYCDKQYSSNNTLRSHKKDCRKRIRQVNS